VRNQKQKGKTKTMTYSSSLAASKRQQTYVRGRNTVSFKEQVTRLGPVTNGVILIVLSCLLGLLYLTQVTKTNSYGYQLDGLSKKQTALKDENADLEVEAARLQSLDKAKNSQVAATLTPVSPSAVVAN